MNTMLRGLGLAAVATVMLTGTMVTGTAQAQDKIVIGISGWTGFAPLSLADKAGLFAKRGVTVETKFIGQGDRLAALASGSIQAAATTVDTHVLWSTSLPITQVVVLDNSNGGDGIVARPSIKSVKDLKGKTLAVDGPGTTPYFVLAYILKKNGMTMKDIKTATLGPQPAAQAFVAGQYDGASTYEPYLSQVRNMKENGKILVTTVDYPVVVDTLGFPSDYVKKNPKQVKAVVDAYFDALDMIKSQPEKAYEIMGAQVKQSGPEFAESAKFIKWLDKKANQDYFATKMDDFLKTATDVQTEAGVLKKKPDLKAIYTAEFVK